MGSTEAEEKKLKVRSLEIEDSVGTPKPPMLSAVEKAQRSKLLLMPYTTARESLQVTVPEMGSLTRTKVVRPVVAPRQVRTELSVGWDTEPIVDCVDDDNVSIT